MTVCQLFLWTSGYHLPLEPLPEELPPPNERELEELLDEERLDEKLLLLELFSVRCFLGMVLVEVRV